jgi:hypothetical protein
VLIAVDARNSPTAHCDLETLLAENIDLIKELIAGFESLAYQGENELDRLRRRAKMIIRRIFGDSSVYLNDFQRITFHPGWTPSAEAVHAKNVRA